ncbi:hypothetical protein [Fluviispira sanaruensis]|uniref:D-alanine--D-alanine ligase n=1 Tax=Fluviispira sanaruensis TaxID=2493639 RepID=A0A4P2VTW7_FLUSA|nr:hypothetical protein [Fluviispira sanaruensis]BBH52865.1 D-alanine--D-alanine ligase [Fluviispira sanaruensis]
MRQNFERKNKKLTLGFVYDLPMKLENSAQMIFPDDASGEWETQNTIEKIIQTWEEIGFSVILFPMDNSFLKNWSEKSSQCSLIHSVVEGWGSLAREGWIPSLCEISGIPFIGSDPFTQSICMSKSQIKLTCQYLNIPTSPFYIIKNPKDLRNIPRNFFNETHFIKPDGEGSGMGINATYSISNSKTHTEKITHALLEKYPHGVLIEKFLNGAEYTSGIIGSPIQNLPIAQIEVDDGIYGLTNKSKDYMGEKVTFPKLTKKIEKIIKKGTEDLFQFLDMKDFVRMDWRCDENDNVYFLEANTLPGISYYYSVLPMMAEKTGINYIQLFETLAESALKRSYDRNLWYGKTRIQHKK